MNARSLSPGVEFKQLQVFPLGQKDRELIDDTSNKLQGQLKTTFSKQPTQYSYLCFVV